MLLNLSSTAAYARTSTSLSAIGTATTLGRKIRVPGATLLNAGSSGSALGFIGSSGFTTRLQFVVVVAGGNLIVGMAGPSASNPSLQAVTATSNINSGESYTIRAVAGPGGCSIGLYDESNTQVALASGAGITVSNNGAANGQVMWGAYTPVPSIVGHIDGDAVYSQAPPATVDAPHPDDPGILWGVLDDSGNIVSGATDLDTLNAASWDAGGDWDAPAPSEPIEVTPGVAALEVVGFAPSISTTADAVLTPAPASMEVTGYAPVVVGTQVWGALGDSQTDEYQGDDERGPAEVLNWLELLVQVRGLDFGAWSDAGRGEPRREGYEYNWARSGVTMPDVIDDQLAGLAAQVAAGTVTHVALFATGNEWVNFGPQYAIAIYNGNGTTSSAGTALSTIVSTVAGQHIACMDDIDEALDTAGSGGGMVVLTPPDYMGYPVFIETFTNATRRGWVAGVIQSIYEAVAAHADSLNDAAGYTRFAVRRSDYHMAAVWGSADGQYMTASGVALDYTEDWEYDPDTYDPYHYALAPTTGSAHIGTIAGGEFARTFVDAANDLTGVSIAQLEDEEILAAAGIDDTAPTLTPAPASLEVTGLAPTVTATAHVAVTPGLASLEVQGAAPTATATAHVTVSPAPASVEAQGYAPAVASTANVTASPAPASLEAAGYAPTASATAHQTVTPAAAEVHATTYAPTVLATAHVSVTPAAASVEVTTYAPSVATTGHVQVVPGTASAAVTTYAPDVAATAHLSVTPGAASLEVATYAPTVTYDGSVSITPSRAQVRVTGHAPTVTGIADVEVTPAPATLAVSTYAPEIGVTVRVAPAPAQVEATGYTPIVTTTEHVVVTPPPGTIAVIGRAPTVVGVAPVSVMPAPGQVVLLAYAPEVSVASVTYPPGPAAPERTASVPAEVRVYLVPAPQTVTL